MKLQLLVEQRYERYLDLCTSWNIFSVLCRTSLFEGERLVVPGPPNNRRRSLILLQNLFPVRINDRLHFHPDIREAAAVAVPDNKYGEVVGAFIVREPSSQSKTRPSKEAVRTWVAEGMNPQVSLFFNALVLFSCNTPYICIVELTCLGLVHWRRRREANGAPEDSERQDSKTHLTRMGQGISRTEYW